MAFAVELTPKTASALRAILRACRHARVELDIDDLPDRSLGREP
ncbi:hypothetical protein [Streptomyces monomycini]|nr:hypothetical protein [Streptomyces monomycini]